MSFVQCETTHSVYEFRRGFCTLVLSCFLIKTYCLSLYGCTLWSLSSASLKLLQTSINKVFRRVWCLPRCSHISIVLSIANMDFVHNCIQKRFNKFLFSCLASKVLLVKLIFSDCYFNRRTARRTGFEDNLPTLQLAIMLCMVNLMQSFLVYMRS